MRQGEDKRLHGRFLSVLLYDGAVFAIRDRFRGERTLVVELAEDEILDGPLTVAPAVQGQADSPCRWLRCSTFRSCSTGIPCGSNSAGGERPSILQ